MQVIIEASHFVEMRENDSSPKIVNVAGNYLWITWTEGGSTHKFRIGVEELEQVLRAMT